VDSADRVWKATIWVPTRANAVIAAASTVGVAVGKVPVGVTDGVAVVVVVGVALKVPVTVGAAVSV
jgi:hypothetical protein